MSLIPVRVARMIKSIAAYKQVDHQTLRSALVNNMHPAWMRSLNHRNLLRLLLFAATALVLGAIGAPAARAATDQPAIIPLDQIKPGMRGVAYTIFAGDKIVLFYIEVVV